MGEKMIEKKKQAAAIAGAVAYLQEEQAAIAMQASVGDIEAEPAIQTPPPHSLWGASGRQSQMQLRNMMQLKAFQRIK